jgi:hypothetical protein
VTGQKRKARLGCQPNIVLRVLMRQDLYMLKGKELSVPIVIKDTRIEDVISVIKM